MDEERRVADLFEERHFVLHHLAVLAQQDAVVRADDEHRVVPHAVPVEGIEHLAEARVALGQQCRILPPRLLDQVA